MKPRICHYEVNLAGPMHLSKGIACQDSVATGIADRVHPKTGLIAPVFIGCVGDGLGSETHSDIGSKVATQAAVSYCVEHLGLCETEEDVMEMMRNCYCAAYDAVLDASFAHGINAGQMDTTLCLAIFGGGRVYWAQAGDSGLLVALTDGTYHVVTKQQRNALGGVFPLCFDDHWEFGQVDGDVVTLALCTDGVLEELVPPILRILEDPGVNPVDTKKARYFLSPFPEDANQIDMLQKEAERYLAKYPEQLINDDKSVVVAWVDGRLGDKQPESYYAGPPFDAVEAALAKEKAGHAPKAPPPPEDDKNDAASLARPVSAEKLSGKDKTVCEPAVRHEPSTKARSAPLASCHSPRTKQTIGFSRVVQLFALAAVVIALTAFALYLRDATIASESSIRSENGAVSVSGGLSRTSTVVNTLYGGGFR